VKRREFITLLGGAAAWPLAARAQQSERVRRIGVLIGGVLETDPQGQARINAFLDGLQKLGWTLGRDIRTDSRWAADDPARLGPYAAELVALAPDILLSGGTPATVALQRATQTIPIVFAQVSDPVAMGLAASLAHPGGNITGFGLHEQVGETKKLELLREIAPTVSRAAFLYDPVNPGWRGAFGAIEASGPLFGVKVSAAPVRDGAEIERTFETFAREPGGGLLVFSSPAVNLHRDLIIALAKQHRLPSVYFYRFFVEDGGLASYGSDNIDFYRRAASYADRILRGEKPGDLPVQLPDKYELVINLKTAKAMSLTVPPTLLAIADEVIE
jgi:putative ABC transport system substrate-binding protein